MIPETLRLIMKGWLENQSQLTLVGEMRSLAVALRCQIGLISDESIGLVTVDGGKLVIDISESGVEFRYSEPREFPVIGKKFGLTAEQQFASGVTIFFPAETVDEEEECLHLSELIE